MQKVLRSSFAILLFLTLASVESHAEILIEPFVGHEQSGSTADGDKTTAIDFGARLGYMTGGLSFGLHYSMFSGDREQTDDAGVEKHDLSGSDLGLFVGYRFPMLIKVWATYFLLSTAKIASYTIDPDGTGPLAALNGDIELKGKGTEIGVGFTFIPFVDLNVSYRQLTYDDNSYTAASYADISDSDRDALVVTLSVPFSL